MPQIADAFWHVSSISWDKSYAVCGQNSKLKRVQIKLILEKEKEKYSEMLKISRWGSIFLIHSGNIVNKRKKILILCTILPEFSKNTSKHHIFVQF